MPSHSQTSYKTARSSPSRNTATNKKKRPGPSTNNSAQSALLKRARGNVKLPPVGSLIYRHFSTMNGGPIGDAIFGVLHHRGTTATAQEMRVVGKNADFSLDANHRAIHLIPHGGIDPYGETIVVHAVGRGVWHDGHDEYRQLRHGQTVESFVKVNAAKLNALLEKAAKNVAASRIQAAWKKYRKFSRSVAENPVVKAALTSSKYMIHISSHGAIVPGKTFVVPRNVVIVFTTTPGAPAYSYYDATISVNRVRKMIRGKDTYYTVAYFEGDTVSEHEMHFDDSNEIHPTHGQFGLFQIVPENVHFTAEYGALVENDPYEPKSLNIRHNAWQKANRSNSQNTSARYLSSIVRYLARVHALRKPREPLVLVVSACRVCSPNNNVGRHVARNVAARRRVSGPGYTLPSTLHNMRRLGMTPFLRNMYHERNRKKNEFEKFLHLNEPDTVAFLGHLHKAGLLNKKFTKGLFNRK